MRERSRVLDSRYLEFLEYLQKLGELQSITRMITILSYDQQEREAGKMMYSFWQRGWIEIREIEKKRENGPGREYVVKVRLKRIVEYFEEERLTRSARSKCLFSGQKTPVPA